MPTVPTAVQIHLAVGSMEMRNQPNDLWSLTEEARREKSRHGGSITFVNKDRARLKLQYFDGAGP